MKEGNVVSSLPTTVITIERSRSTKISIITIDVTPLAPITAFVERKLFLEKIWTLQRIMIEQYKELLQCTL